MHSRTVVLILTSFILGTISIGFVYAWSGPTAAPPNDNVAAPINVGSTDQVKDGGIGVNKLAVFGNSLLGGFTGSNAYLNFGAIPTPSDPSTGYGIRDNGGTLEFKNDGGSWQSIQNTLYTLCGGDCSGGGGGTPVAFSVNKGGTNQSVSADTITKVTWGNEVFDTNNNFANDQFTPTVPGKYILSANVYCWTDATYCEVFIYKNGSTIAANSIRSPDSSVHVTIVADMNGTSDTVEVRARAGNGNTISGNTNYTYFTGALLSPQSSSGSGGITGWERNVTTVPFNSATGWYYAHCTSGKKILGGSCSSSNGSVGHSDYISDDHTYGCYTGACVSCAWSIVAICANAS